MREAMKRGDDTEVMIPISNFMHQSMNTQARRETDREAAIHCVLAAKHAISDNTSGGRIGIGGEDSTDEEEEEEEREEESLLLSRTL